MLAIALANKPIVISSTGPTTPTPATIVVINPLTPSPRPLNFSSIFVPNSIIGVTSLRNCSPTGASAVWKSVIAFSNL